MDVVAWKPSSIRMFKIIVCSMMEALALETAKIVMRVFLGIVYVCVGNSPAPELVGKGKNAEGEVVEDGKVDDGSCDGSKHNGGENGDALGQAGEWTSNDDGYDGGSDEDDASGQQGSDDSGQEGDENGDEEDESNEFLEEDFPGSDSEEDEEPLLDHAMEVYASDSFSLFRHEYLKSKALLVDPIDDSEPGVKYHVRRVEDKYCSLKCHKVSANFLPGTVDCCCNHFAVTGMLCSHALAVLKVMRIDRIPDKYLLKWRLKSMNQSLIGDASLQSRRKMIHSHDDCLNRFWKKKKTSEYSEEHTLPLFILPNFGEDTNCDNTNHFGSPILIHAKHIYVPEAYELFREEHRKSEYFMAFIHHKFVDWRGLVYYFEVCKLPRNDLHKVHAEAKDGTVKCSCRKFETLGILCAHALAVFNAISIVKVPHQYLVHRLLKDPNMAADENIHGPEYEFMLKFAAYKICNGGSTIVPIIPNHTWSRNDGENFDAVNAELGEVASRKRKAGCIAEEEMPGKWKLYDDQLIKDYTYKMPETKKRNLMDYTKTVSSKFF